MPTTPCRTAYALALPLLLAALLLPAAACGPGDEEFSAETAGYLRAALHDVPQDGDDRVRSAMARFYAQRSYAPAWVERQGVTEAGEELLETLDSAGEQGLDPTDYRTDALRASIEAFREQRTDDAERARRAAALDAELTFAFLTLASHVGNGRTRPEDAGIAWHITPRELDLAATLQRAIDDHGVRGSLRALEPPHAGYRQLAELHERYRALVEKGGWEPIPDGPALKEGDTGPRVAALRQRFAATGDLESAGEGEAAAAYDEELAAAVGRYQQRYGLEPDGVAGPEVLTALNLSAEERLRQMAANLERWRWLPEELGSRYVLVNVPRYELTVVEDGEPVRVMRIVVGDEYNATPVFSEEMAYLVFNPTWNVPSSIAREEILPQLAANPGHLAENDMQLVRGWSDDAEVLDPWLVGPEVAAGAGSDGSDVRIRQLPGPSNPLGRVKFMFPNEFNIYLHDTNARHLFAQTDRNLSHGCIRVEDPVWLASFVLGEPESEIRRRMASPETENVQVPRKIPVHILYWTVFVDEESQANFRHDLYDVDTRVLAALDGVGPATLDLEIPEEPMAVPAEGEGEEADEAEPEGDAEDPPPSKPKQAA